MIPPQTSGVYCLKALDNKLIYIGSTNNLRKRKNVHLSQIKLNNRNKGCIPMIDAYHSGDFVIFEVIELCGNYLEREQYWIDFYSKQDTFKVVNQFGADRNNSSSTEEFKSKMSNILKERWKNPDYREKTLLNFKNTQFTSEKLSKVTHVFTTEGEYVNSFKSAMLAQQELKLPSKISLSAAARGEYKGKHKYKGLIFIYNEKVLDKLDELLEAHQELRVISSQAWEAMKMYQEGSTTNQ